MLSTVNRWLGIVTIVALLSTVGCGGGSVGSNTPPTQNTKATYEGPQFGDDENGGLGYTNTDVLVRPPDQNDGNKGRINGQLTTSDLVGDEWRYDLYTFTAIESGTRSIELVSDDFDAVLAVFRVYPDGYWEYLGLDDDSAGDRNARFGVDADRNAVYVVTVTSYHKGDTGDYQVLFSPGLTYATTRKVSGMDFARPHR